MVNTLLNIEKAKSSVWGLERILKSLQEVELTNRLNPSPSIELQSKLFVDKDIVAVKAKIKEFQGEIAIATKEWEVVDSFIEIYDLEAHTIYHKLTGEQFPTRINYNTKKGLKNLENLLSEMRVNITSQEQARKAYYDNDDCVVGFGYKYQSSLDEANEKHSKRSKDQQDAYKEWNDIEEAIKQQELTADKYLSVIKELIAEQTPKI